MRNFLYRLAQWTWGLPQTLIGALIALSLRGAPRFLYHGAVVTVWKNHGSMSMGMFLFLAEHLDGLDAAAPTGYAHEILRHEYGHTYQSLMLGPLYLLVIGLPSIIWAQSARLRRWRKETGRSYSWLYTEGWADRLGGVGKR